MSVYRHIEGKKPYDTFAFDTIPYLIVKNKKLRPKSLILAFEKQDAQVRGAKIQIEIDHLNQALVLFPYLYQQEVDLDAIQEALKHKQILRLQFDLKPLYLERYAESLAAITSPEAFFQIHNTTGQSVMRCLDIAYDYRGIQRLVPKAA